MGEITNIRMQEEIKVEDERFDALVEEINAIVVELRRTERETPIHRHYYVGEAIRNNSGDGNITTVVDNLARATHCTTRHLWDSVQIYDHFPYKTLSDVPDGTTIADVRRQIRGEEETETVIRPQEFAAKTYKRWLKKYGDETDEIIDALVDEKNTRRAETQTEA